MFGIIRDKIANTKPTKENIITFLPYHFAITFVAIPIPNINQIIDVAINFGS